MPHRIPHTAGTPTNRSASRARTPRRAVLVAAAAALLLAACGNGAEEPQAGDEVDPDGIEDLEDLEGLEEELEGLDDLDGLDEDPMADLEDPNELVADGLLAANGLIVPAPEGWTFDQMAFAQGITVASAPVGLEQPAAQVLMPDALPESMDFDAILEDARASVEEEPAVDQEVEVTGAERAVELRYLDLPFQQGEVDTEISEVSIIAEREDGALALFNYTADVEDFDDGVAEELLASAGFDPDSEPVELPMPQAP